MKTTIVRVLVAALLSGAPGMPAPVRAEAARPAEEKEDKAEKERRKREEKAAEKDQKEQDQARDLLDEIQPDIDSFAKTLIGARYDDPFLQDYVNEMGQRLVPKEASPGVLFSFRVVADPTPNAYALPDGRIYVNTGLLVFVRNEAQLALVLGHEIGHVVEQHQIEAIKASRSIKRRLLPGLIGAVAGAALGAVVKGKEGAEKGAVLGAVGGFVYSAVALNSYGRKQEDEADVVGTRLALARGYDPKEAVAFFQSLADTFGDKDRFSNLLWGNHSRNVDRVGHAQALLDGELSSVYNSQRAAGNLTLGSGQMKLYTSRMFRDTAILYMNESDRYDIAKMLLDSIIDYRTRDPLTLWAIGRVYKMVGRSPEDKAKALDYLQKAVQTDERNVYPFVNRDLGLMQARLADTSAGMAPAVESIKKYVRAYIDRNGEYPPDMLDMYDYLLIFGDSKWTAPKVESMVIRASTPARVQETVASESARKALLPQLPPKKKPGIN